MCVCVRVSVFVGDFLHSKVAEVITRRDQLALTASKKAKAVESGEVDDYEGTGRKRGKAKAKAKSKACAKGKAKAKATSKKKSPEVPPVEAEYEDEQDGAWEDDAYPVVEEAAGKRKLRRMSKKRLLCKGGSKKKKLGKNKPVAKEDGPEEKECPEDIVTPAPKRVRGKSSSPNVVVPPREKDDESLTFARRYYPKRPVYQAKWQAIKSAYVDRIRWAVVGHSSLEVGGCHFCSYAKNP